jgi:CBS domain-containing protein
MPAVAKILNKPFIVLIKKHEHQKTRARIENAVIKNEAKKLRDSEDFGKLGLKRIITKEKTFHAEPVIRTSAKRIISIEENEKLAKAIQLMLKNDIRGLAVMSGSELKGAVESEDIVKHIESIAPKQTEAFMSRPVREIARPAETIETDVSFGKAIQQMDETKANRIFVVENQKPVGVVSTSDVLQKVMGSSSQFGAKIETGIDKLLELVEQRGKISTDEASKLLKVDIKMIEDWASILDDHNLIKLEYPIIGTIELIKK